MIFHSYGTLPEVILTDSLGMMKTFITLKGHIFTNQHDGIGKGINKPWSVESGPGVYQSRPEFISEATPNTVSSGYEITWEEEPAQIPAQKLDANPKPSTAEWPASLRSLNFQRWKKCLEWLHETKPATLWQSNMAMESFFLFTSFCIDD